MRVISGDCKGIPLRAVPGTNTRPTTDKVKESMFNIIGPYFDGGFVVDLFAGSGSLGIEALSRGMDHGYFVDRDRKAVQTIQQNLEKCRLLERATILPLDAKKAVERLAEIEEKIDLLFVDPPYKELRFYTLVEKLDELALLSERTTVVCEHDKGNTLPLTFGNFRCTRTEIYGQIALSFYHHEEN
ncbi:16S rRNA (guanine(966)-N(2))-methyltransferase RsmD [Paenisporosarcina cavernae]|uniref:16S rRNA (Guanine(966)-N(2))-methyltransferase RsmD n=1 Tax=Paenisporosarcina cavernae TaxID=2320858 RepID=A0A385YRM2_9BACL|nr:16S rRNA (guanine(966)-N(2))-methyltransferase RsmD [Paenisporosarcina cavernae]AYC29141.1 16S rRNA (guanine(966)-N(2))-methyltransferase RsmD [Paenisporosarcina cavernae]